MSEENFSQTDQAAGADRDFLESAVRAIVSNPDDVKVERRVDDLGVLITLQVGQNDMKSIIGKAGRTAKALRTLLRVVGSRHDERVNLKILEADGSEYRVEREGRGRGEEKSQPAESTPATAAGADAESAFDEIA